MDFFYWESDNFFFISEISLNIQVLQLFKDNKVKSCWRMKNINHLDLHWRRKGETSVTPLEVKVNCIISYSLASLIQIICFIWINQTIFCLTRINHTFFYFQSLPKIPLIFKKYSKTSLASSSHYYCYWVKGWKYFHYSI